MKRSGWAMGDRVLDREHARASSRMEGRRGARRRDEKKPRGEGEEGGGGLGRPRGSEREHGLEREEWPEMEMKRHGEAGAWSS